VKRHERVWYDDNPGRVVEADGRGNVTVDWDHGGTTTVRRSDLLTDRERADLEGLV
jgi:hypothetical protein